MFLAVSGPQTHMLDIKFIKEFPEVVKAACKNKKVDADVDLILALDGKRRECQTKLEEVNRARNEAAKNKDIENGKALKLEAGLLDKEIAEVEAALAPLLRKVPNVPSVDTPIGPDESGNVVIRTVGEKPVFDFEVRDHVAIGEMFDMIDNAKASIVAGARFTYLKGDLVLLQNALAQFALSIVTNRDALKAIIAEAGINVVSTPFIPVIPPLFIKPEVFERMARLEPRDERYHIPSDDAYLIGSAEHTLGPIHMDETLAEGEMPRRYVAYTPAFRREAGSYGKDTRGILRLHQFDKIEMESFALPETSTEEQDLFVAIQEHMLKALGVPYQVMQICTGDMGGPDVRQIDIECWMPGQDRYRETHTSDLMTDYQARRLNTRVRRNAGGTEYVHMNDATLMAMGRLLIAIMENFQQADGSVRVPQVLVPYMYGRSVIGPAHKDVHPL